MNHIGTQPLSTERLLLRKYRPEDAQAMFDNWASEDEVTKYLTWQTYKSVSDAESYIAYVCGQYSHEDHYDWVIELKEIGQPIGSISAVKVEDRLELVEIGYCLGSRWWGRGIMPEALKAVIAFFFEQVGVNRVEAYHNVNNPNSGRVMQKCGMTYEGTLRQSGWCNQGISDCAYYGILRVEYFAGIREGTCKQKAD